MNTSNRNAIRAFLDSCDMPQWSCEIVSATGCRPQHISGMVADGSLVKHTDQHPHSYTVGIRPRVRDTAEQQARRRQAERERITRRNEKLKAERRARGIPERKPKSQQPTVKLALVRSHATVGGESVAEFIARGGSIERLPGIQKSEVFAQRRPVMGSYRSVST